MTWLMCCFVLEKSNLAIRVYAGFYFCLFNQTHAYLMQLDSQCQSFSSCLPSQMLFFGMLAKQSRAYFSTLQSYSMSLLPSFSGQDLSFQCCVPGTPPGPSSQYSHGHSYRTFSTMDLDTTRSTKKTSWQSYVLLCINRSIYSIVWRDDLMWM